MYTQFRIVLPPDHDTVTVIDGEHRWYLPRPGAELVPFLGPWVADWHDWLEERGVIERHG